MRLFKLTAIASVLAASSLAGASAFADNGEQFFSNGSFFSDKKEATERTGSSRRSQTVARSTTRTTATTTARASHGYTHPLPNSVHTQGVHKGHSGDDYAAPIGTPVVAAASGKVIEANNGTSNGGRGRYIEIASGGCVTKYYHLNRIVVQVGSTVSSGDHIGDVGNTGRSTGPHLHFENDC
jgi:murein DD-endopeptidase MepM/ murein hydrolase activator NlpD